MNFAALDLPMVMQNREPGDHESWPSTCKLGLGIELRRATWISRSKAEEFFFRRALFKIDSTLDGPEQSSEPEELPKDTYNFEELVEKPMKPGPLGTGLRWLHFQPSVFPVKRESRVAHRGRHPTFTLLGWQAVSVPFDASERKGKLDKDMWKCVAASGIPALME